MNSAILFSLIVWNVGQGQWITFENPHQCFHFDMGGEKNPIEEVLKTCAHKKNQIFISHEDWDHYSFVQSFLKAQSQSCLANTSVEKIETEKLRRWVADTASCSLSSEKKVATLPNDQRSPNQVAGEEARRPFLFDPPTLLFSPTLQVFSDSKSSSEKYNIGSEQDIITKDRSLQPVTSTEGKRRKGEKNSKSWVYSFAGVLIPGDSPKKSELQWIRNLPNQSLKRHQIYGLILGHHGSKTSSSEELLNKLPHLKWAVASAREEKYHHPHPSVRARLKAKKIPLLRTEDWGHIKFQVRIQPSNLRF